MRAEPALVATSGTLAALSRGGDRAVPLPDPTSHEEAVNCRAFSSSLPKSGFRRVLDRRCPGPAPLRVSAACCRVTSATSLPQPPEEVLGRSLRYRGSQPEPVSGFKNHLSPQTLKQNNV